MDGSLSIFSAQIYVNALNTMHSLLSVTQTGYCALKGKAVALCEVGQVREVINS